MTEPTPARERIAALLVRVWHESLSEDDAVWGEMADAVLAEFAVALKKYGAEHVEGECQKWVGSDRGYGWTWVQDNPCTCGLSAHLAPAPPVAGRDG